MGKENITATIKCINNTPTLLIDGKPTYLAIYRSVSPTLRGYDGAECARIFADAGIHLVSIDIGTRSSSPEWIKGDGKSGIFDFSSVATRFGKILDADPDAKLLLRISLEMPEWWRECYPQECEILSNGEVGMQSFASKIWQAQSQDFLKAFIDHLKKIGLVDRVFAYQPGGGDTTEWVKPFAMKDQCGDYSPPMQAHFREWLFREYTGDQVAFRKAWHNRNVSFETAAIPVREQQLGLHNQTFRDPVFDRPVIDYYRCWNDLVADLAIESCKTIKSACGNRSLAGVFFGKYFELAWNSAFFGDGDTSETSAYQRSGHIFLNRILESPYIDFITSSYMYSFRGIGGVGASMLPTESVTLHGKIHLYDDDTRTHLSVQAGNDYGRVKNLNDSLAVIKRNFSEALTRNLAITWLSGTRTSPHLHPGMEPEFKKLLIQMKRIGDFSLHLDRSPKSEIAVILDASTFLFETMRNDYDLPAIVQQRLWGLPRIGAPFDIYLQNDLTEGRVPQYKLYVFLNSFAVDRDQRYKIKLELVRSGGTALWIYAPGYLPDKSLDSMTDLTGFRFGKGEHAWGPQIYLTNLNHPLTQGVYPESTWGTNQRLNPVFYLEDEGADILGQVVLSQGRCVPGFGVKKLAGWTSIYSAAPNIPASILRGIARYAGVHIFSNEGDVFSASRNLISFHSTSGGRREIKLKERVEMIFDLFSDRIIEQNTDRFKLELQPASTSLFYIGSNSNIEEFWKNGDHQS